MTDAEASIVLERELAQPVEDVWAAWVEPERLTRWLAPKAHVELRVGGPYELFWDPAHPSENSTVGCTILAVNEEYAIKISWKGPPEFSTEMNGTPLPTWVEVRFQPLGPGRTRLRLEHGGWGSGLTWTEARIWQESAWKKALDALESHFSPP